MRIQGFESDFESARAYEQSWYLQHCVICRTSDDEMKSTLNYPHKLTSTDYTPVIFVSPSIAVAIA